MPKLKLHDGSEIDAYTEDEVKQRIETEVTGLKSKVEELLGESKSAKQKARELEELQRQQEEESLKKSQQFQTLYEREQKARAEIESKFSEFSRKFQEKEVALATSQLAGNLTRDTKRAQLLQKEIAEFARFTDEGVKFEMGGVEVDAKKVQDYITENFPFLVDGSGASGGGATGSSRGGAAVPRGNMGGSREERRAAIAAKFNLN